MKKGLLKVVLCLLILAVAACWLPRVFTPTYPGRLVIDLCNNSWQSMRGMTITFEDSDAVLDIPDVYPKERVILIVPDDIFDRAVRTRVFLNIGGTKYEIMGEYHTLTGDLYNQDVVQAVRLAVNQNSVKLSERGVFGLSYRLRPYIRTIELNRD